MKDMFLYTGYKGTYCLAQTDSCAAVHRIQKLFIFVHNKGVQVALRTAATSDGSRN